MPKINGLILGAVIIRLFFATFFYHPDLRVYYFHGQFLKTGVLNIYSYLEQNRASLPNSNRFNYPPLAYLFFGSWYTVSSVIAGPGLDTWINDWSGQDVYHPQLFFYQLLLKLPYFALDLLSLSVLLTFARSHPQKKFLSAAWLFNPLTLYGIYAVGQFDLLPALLTLLAAALVVRGRLTKASLLLVIGGLLKTYPLLLLPFVLIRSKSWRESLTILLPSIALWLTVQAPFFASPGYSQSVLNSGLANRIFSAGLDLGGGIVISPFVAVYLVILAYSFFARRAKLNLIPEFFAVTILVVLLTPFHAQWLIWSLPFALILLSRSPSLWLPLTAVMASAFGLILLLPDIYVSVGLLAGLNPFLKTIPALPPLIKAQILLRSTLVVTGFIAIFKSLKYES